MLNPHHLHNSKEVCCNNVLAVSGKTLADIDQSQQVPTQPAVHVGQLQQGPIKRPGQGPRPQGQGLRPQGQAMRPQGQAPRMQGQALRLRGQTPRMQGQVLRPRGQTPRPQGQLMNYQQRGNQNIQYRQQAPVIQGKNNFQQKGLKRNMPPASPQVQMSRPSSGAASQSQGGPPVMKAMKKVTVIKKDLYGNIIKKETKIVPLDTDVTELNKNTAPQPGSSGDNAKKIALNKGNRNIASPGANPPQGRSVVMKGQGQTAGGQRKVVSQGGMEQAGRVS